MTLNNVLKAADARGTFLAANEQWCIFFINDKGKNCRKVSVNIRIWTEFSSYKQIVLIQYFDTKPLENSLNHEQKIQSQ